MQSLKFDYPTNSDCYKLVVIRADISVIVFSFHMNNQFVTFRVLRDCHTIDAHYVNFPIDF